MPSLQYIAAVRHTTFLLLCLALAVPSVAGAQSPLSGVVTDESGGVVPNASVIVRTASGVEHQTVTSSEGRFTVNAPVNGNGNAIYKFTPQGVRSAFASVDGIGQRFWYLAFQPLPSCCQ